MQNSNSARIFIIKPLQIKDFLLNLPQRISMLQHSNVAMNTVNGVENICIS